MNNGWRSDRIFEVCPRCLVGRKQDLMKQSCADCGFTYREYARYDVVPYTRLNEEEGWLYKVVRRRRVTRLKPDQHRTFMGVLSLLREHRDLWYTKYEIKMILMKPSVSPITKVLKLMYELGIVETVESEGKLWYKFEATGRSTYEARKPKSKEERERERLHDELEEDSRVMVYVQNRKDGEWKGEFVWVQPETKQKIEEHYRKKMEARYSTV